METSMIAGVVIIGVLALAYVVFMAVTWHEGKKVGEEKDHANEDRLKNIHTS